MRVTGSVLMVSGLTLLAGCGDGEEPVSAEDVQQQERAMLAENAEQAASPEDSQTRDLPSTRQADTPAMPAPAGDDDAGDAVAEGDLMEVAGVAFTVPESWEQLTPTSSMRAAEYKVGQSGSFVVFVGIGGGAEANIQRWIGQVSNPVSGPTRDTIEAGGFTAQTVEMVGTYSGMTMMGGSAPAEPNTAFYGAEVEGVSTPVQIRLTINASEADQAREQFFAMMRSMRPAG